MQVNVTARHGEMSDPTREKIVAEVSKLSRFWDRITTIDVVVDLEPAGNPVVEVQIHSQRAREFYVQSQVGELFASLNDAIRKLEQQLKKFKEKKIDSHRGGGGAAEVRE